MIDPIKIWGQGEVLTAIALNMELANIRSQALTEVPNTLEIFSVKEYGALGDGSTNDTTAINDAMSDAPEGGTIFFPAGIYRCNPTITPDKALRFTGTAAILEPNNTGVPFVVFPQGSRDLFIHNLIFRDRGVRQTGFLFYGGSSGNSLFTHNVRVTQNLFDGWDGETIRLTTAGGAGTADNLARRIRVDNNVFQGIGEGCFTVVAGYDCSFDHNYVEVTHKTTGSSGNMVAGAHWFSAVEQPDPLLVAKRINFSDNHVVCTMTTASAWEGYVFALEDNVRSYAEGAIDGVVIKDNLVSGKGFRSLVRANLRGSNVHIPVSVSDNVVLEMGRHGIEYIGSTGGASIQGDVIRSFGLETSNTYDGITLRDTRGALVSSNTIRGTDGRYGVSEEEMAGGQTVGDNRILDNLISGPVTGEVLVIAGDTVLREI